ncbi:hypothetical protein BaRGS_00037671, partial [Batillaria attramentaria]
AIFEFPTLNDSTLTAKENSTIILPFYINTDQSCNLSDNVTIRVQVLDGEIIADVCSIRHSSESCYAPGLENGCECKNGTGFYHLKKTADRIDNIRWLFTTDDGMVRDKEITFNILYPATVEGVTLMSDDNETLSLPVEPGPPHFEEGRVNRIAENTGRVDLSFRFRAHNTTLSGCLIIKDVGSLPSDSHGSSGNATDKLRYLSTTHNVSAYSFDPKELGVFPFRIISIAAGVAVAVGAGMCAVFFIFRRLCQGAHTESQPRIEKGTQRTAHAEPEDQEDELVMIDNVVYSAMPSPPYEGIAVCPPPPPAKCSVEVKERSTQRTAHAEPEDQEDELVMIDNVVYSAMPSPPYEGIAVCPPPPPAKPAVSK